MFDKKKVTRFMVIGALSIAFLYLEKLANEEDT